MANLCLASLTRVFHAVSVSKKQDSDSIYDMTPSR